MNLTPGSCMGLRARLIPGDLITSFTIQSRDADYYWTRPSKLETERSPRWLTRRSRRRAPISSPKVRRAAGLCATPLAPELLNRAPSFVQSGMSIGLQDRPRRCRGFLDQYILGSWHSGIVTALLPLISLRRAGQCYLHIGGLTQGGALALRAMLDTESDEPLLSLPLS